MSANNEDSKPWNEWIELCLFSTAKHNSGHEFPRIQLKSVDQLVDITLKFYDQIQSSPEIEILTEINGRSK